MTVFVVCSALAAAGFATAFEVGRVCEKRLSGSSKTALPFDGFDWKSEEAETAAKVFGALFLFENVFFPRALNPMSYVLLPADDSGLSAFLAFLVFGSWSGILALGCGGVAASLRGLKAEREAIEAKREERKQQTSRAEAKLREEEERVEKQKRLNIASSAAVAGEWKKLHIAREDHNEHTKERSENEKIWSKTVTKGLDKKTMHVVDNALDKRWREVDEQKHNLEAFRMRNKEKEKKIREQRAQRAERLSNQMSGIQTERDNLLKLAKELEGLKENMERLKAENTKKEQEKLRDLKDRETALRRKENYLERHHSKKLEQLKIQEQTLKEREERFETGEERTKLLELSEKLESSKLTVAKFNENIMMKERQKNEEFRRRELELREKEEEISRRVRMNVKNNVETVVIEPYDDTEEMPDDEALLSRKTDNREPEAGQGDETDSATKEESNDKVELPTNEKEDDSADDDLPTEESDREEEEDDETVDTDAENSLENELPMIPEESASDSVDTDEKSVSMRLLVEQDIVTVPSERIISSSSSDLKAIQENTVPEDTVPVVESQDEEKDTSTEAAPVVESQDEEKDASTEEDAETTSETPEENAVETAMPTLLINIDEDEEKDKDKDKEIEQQEKEEVEEPATDSALAGHDQGDDSSYKSFLDALEDEEDDTDSDSTCMLNVNEDFETRRNTEFVLGEADNDDDDDDDVSNASTNMFNIHADNDAVATEHQAPYFPSTQGMETNNANGHQSEYESDNDSLFHQIQDDTAVNKHAAESLIVDSSGSSTTFGESAGEGAPLSVSSPLQNRDENQPGGTLPTAAEAAKGKNSMAQEQSIPTSPISATDGSFVSYKDTNLSMVDSDSFKDAHAEAANSLDSDSLFPEKENDRYSPKHASPKRAAAYKNKAPPRIGIYVNNKKIASVRSPRTPADDKVIVNEEAGVEVIAWSERSRSSLF